MKELLSIRSYARRRGVSHKAVQKAIADGRIPLEPGKLIDPAKADVAWATNTDVAKALEADVRRGRSAEEIEAERRDTARFRSARAKREEIKAEREAIDLRIHKDELVDKGESYARVFNHGRILRDQVLNWAPRVYAILAAESGADPAKLFHSLEREVDALLHQIADQLEERQNSLFENIKTPTSGQR